MSISTSPTSFASTQRLFNAAQATKLGSLPELPRAPVGAVLMALEAKAAMTEHVKALPRLYDELNSSHPNGSRRVAPGACGRAGDYARRERV